MEAYPDHATYEALYKRYYERPDRSELLRAIEPLRGMRVLDLCGGDGLLSFLAVQRGAREAVLIEASPVMVPANLGIVDHRIRVRLGTVASRLASSDTIDAPFDRIMCRQAVNYWLNAETSKLVAAALKPRGIFVFNTFNQEPPKKPCVLEYELDGHAFTEVSWLVGDMVHHVQVRDEMMPHHTSFKWIPPETFQILLRPHFSIVMEARREKSSIYTCMKR